MSPRIYVACLASYNNGVLHGAWMDATDADAMREEIATMLRASPYPNVTVDCPACVGATDPVAVLLEATGLCPTCRGTGKVPSAEEYAVHDYDDFGGLASTLGEYPDLDKLAEIADMLDKHGDAYAAYVAWRGVEYATVEDFEQCYQGEHDNVTRYAEQCADDMGLLDGVPDTVKNYFDYEAFGRDMELGGDIAAIDHGHSSVFIFDNH